MKKLTEAQIHARMEEQQQDEILALRSRLADLEAERALIVTRAENAEAALAYAASTGDECAIEIESLRSRLAEAEALISSQGIRLMEADDVAARLAEAERLLTDARRNLNVGTLQGKACQREIDALLRPADSAPAVACEHCGATDRHFGGCYYAGQRVTL